MLCVHIITRPFTAVGSGSVPDFAKSQRGKEAVANKTDGEEVQALVHAVAGGRICIK